MTPILLTIPGEPVAKARPRWAKFGIYTPKKTVNYETLIKELFATKYPGFKPIADGPLRLELRSFFSIPKSKSKKQQALMLKGEIRPAKRPDLDNIMKAALDGLSGVAFRDDCQFVEIFMEKYYSDEPRLDIVILPISFAS
jgi:Holliday junction resolvase RusA-like endonuclease